MTESPADVASAEVESQPEDGASEVSASQEGTLRRVIRLSGLDRLGALYVLGLIIIIFSIWRPELFPTVTTVKSILNQNAILALVALSLVVPLSTGTFDLSIGNAMGLSSVVLAWLAIDHHIAIGFALALTVLMSVGIGLLNGFVIVVCKIDSFIGTLGTGAVLTAINYLISNNVPETSSGFSSSISKFSDTSLGGFQIPVFIAALVTIVMWWWLRYTITGRRMYATGFNPEAARLAGVRTDRLRFAGLVTSGTVAGIAGILVTASIASSSPEVGNSYLLTAFAAAFLGATQVQTGRFNAIGTIIAVLVIGTGTAGLTLVGAGQWAQQLYTGVVLLVSLGLTRLERSRVISGSRT